MFNGTNVAKMNGQKQLGLILDSRLPFKNHLNEKIIKVKKYLGIIKYLSIFLPHKTLDLMYKALVCPHLDYSDIIYHTIKTGSTWCDLKCPNGKNPERIKYQAALVVTGTW